MPSANIDIEIKRIYTEMSDIQKDSKNAELITQIAERLDFSDMFDLPKLWHIDDYPEQADRLLPKVFWLRPSRVAHLDDLRLVQNNFKELGCSIWFNAVLDTARGQAIKLLAMKHLYENDNDFKNE